MRQLVYNKIKGWKVKKKLKLKRTKVKKETKVKKN